MPAPPVAILAQGDLKAPSNCVTFPLTLHFLPKNFPMEPLTPDQELADAEALVADSGNPGQGDRPETSQAAPWRTPLARLTCVALFPLSSSRPIQMESSTRARVHWVHSSWWSSRACLRGSPRFASATVKDGIPKGNVALWYDIKTCGEDSSSANTRAPSFCPAGKGPAGVNLPRLDHTWEASDKVRGDQQGQHSQSASRERATQHQVGTR